MKFYDITYIIEDEQQERLLALAERYEKVNGWNEKEILQFAVTATSKNDIESKLHFLENEIIKLQKDWKEQEKNPKKKEDISAMKNTKNAKELSVHMGRNLMTLKLRL